MIAVEQRIKTYLATLLFVAPLFSQITKSIFATPKLLEQTETLIEHGKKALLKAQLEENYELYDILDYQLEQVVGSYGILKRDNFLLDGKDTNGIFTMQLMQEAKRLRDLLWPKNHNIHRPVKTNYFVPLIAAALAGATYLTSQYNLIQKILLWIHPKPPTPPVPDPNPPVPPKPPVIQVLTDPDPVIRLHGNRPFYCNCGNAHTTRKWNRLQLFWAHSCSTQAGIAKSLKEPVVNMFDIYRNQNSDHDPDSN